MTRKNRDYSRPISADARFSDTTISKFINCMMQHGKKSLAESIMYDSLDLIETRYKENGKEVFDKAMATITPVIEVRSRRVGGANYQVPTEVRAARRQALSIRWIIAAARQRSEKTMTERLANEIYDASQKRGGAFKKKEDTHKMAEANRAFAHYRW